MTTVERASALRLPNDRTLDFSIRPRIMGVVNVTPDSFSDGGRFLEPDRAVEHALALLEEGADLVDLGAESTRPGGGVYGEGAAEVNVALEQDRLLPVLEKLRPLTAAPISVDTRKGAVARAALDAGADLVNDTSALADASLAAAVAASGCPVVLMHSRGELRAMQQDIHFDDLLADVRRELLAAVERGERAGIDRRQMVLDPGIGFGKTHDQNLALIRWLGELSGPGFALLLGASRKSFIGRLTDTAVDDRLAGSLAAVAWAATHEVELVRVHDVAATRQFLTVWQAIRNAPGKEA
jgi:dihydropteroate synthase